MAALSAHKGHLTRIRIKCEDLLENGVLGREHVSVAKALLDKYRTKLSAIEIMYEKLLDEQSDDTDARVKTLRDLDSLMSDSLDFESPFVAALTDAEGQVSNVKGSYNFKLNELDVESFSGSGGPASYFRFKSAFNAALAGVGNMSNSQKLLYLKTKLQGTAHALVAPLVISNDNYDRAWASLDATFADRDLAISLALAKITAAEGVKDERDPGVIMSYLLKVREHLLALKDLGLDFTAPDTPGERLMSELVAAKLPSFFRTEVKRKFNKSVPLISDYLEVSAEILRTFDPPKSVRPKQTEHNDRVSKQFVTPSSSRASVTQGAVAKPKVKQPQAASVKTCKFCKSEEHSSLKCKQYATHPIRVQRLHDLGGCVRCMGMGHNSSTCKVKISWPCSVCAGRDHVSPVCPKFVMSSGQ